MCLHQETVALQLGQVTVVLPAFFQLLCHPLGDALGHGVLPKSQWP